MTLRLRAATAGLLAAVCALIAPVTAAHADPVQAAHATPTAKYAALQVALRGMRLYTGPVDGFAGPRTIEAVRDLQRREGLTVDGAFGPRTKAALGRRGKPSLGSRATRRGNRGWDVAAIQFLLKRKGQSPGSVDGGFGARTRDAVIRFQRAARLRADGIAGSATISALRRASSPSLPGNPSGPVRFLRPLGAPITSGYGPRWGRMHRGIDFGAPTGTPIGAAGRGTVAFAGWNSGGFGYLVVVRHRLGFETWYAHMSSIQTAAGRAVVGGSRIGLIGSTGNSTGPHLHFEVRLNGTPINPVPYMLTSTAARIAAAGIAAESADDPDEHDAHPCAGAAANGGSAPPRSRRAPRFAGRPTAAQRRAARRYSRARFKADCH